jgi:hypothetical protein
MQPKYLIIKKNLHICEEDEVLISFSSLSSDLIQQLEQDGIFTIVGSSRISLTVGEKRKEEGWGGERNIRLEEKEKKKKISG